MKPKEAIDTLKALCAAVEWDFPLDYAAAIDAAIEALEKQVPKKPTGDHYAHMRCPSCNHKIPSGMGSSSRRRDNWCNYCGQKICWEGE